MRVTRKNHHEHYMTMHRAYEKLVALVGDTPLHDLAEITGYPKARLRDILAGRTVLTLRTLTIIAEAYGREVDVVFRKVGEAEPCE